MWKPEHRPAAERPGLRYPRDLTDAEWALAEPMIPPARPGGRPRDVNAREVLNAIFYVLSAACQWKALPKDLPPKSAAHYYFMLWDWDITLERIHHALYVAVREREGREASPTAAIIDSQSAKAAQKGALRLTRKGTTRARRLRAAIDLLLSVVVHPADVQDRDGARELLHTARRLFPFVERIFAYAGYRGPKMAKVVANAGNWTLQIIKRSDAHRFAPRRQANPLTQGGARGISISGLSLS